MRASSCRVQCSNTPRTPSRKPLHKAENRWQKASSPLQFKHQQVHQLREFLKTLIQLTDSDLVLLENCCTQIEVNKGHILLQEGKIAQKLYFVEQGLVCGKLNRDGKEIINWFSYEKQFVTSLFSFISRKPSYESIETLEKCLLFEIRYENLQLLYRQIPTFEKLGRVLTEQYYIQLEERAMSLQYLSAKERFEQFVMKEPRLYQRISLGQLSSFLGISQETLSRIRAKK